MNDIPGIDTVAELFPAKPRSELASRLLCSSSVETLIEELLMEQSSQTESGYSEDVQNIKHMFPKIKSCDIAAQLQQNGNDFEATINHLMQSDTVGQLSQMMGLPEATVRPILAKHNNDIYEASADLVAHHRPQTRVWTSRVQDRKSTVLKDAYIFDDGKKETQELNEYIRSESALRELNYDFLVKSLSFFQGDIFKVLELARRFIEDNKTQVTFKQSLGFETRSLPGKGPPPASEVLKQNLQQKLSNLPVLGDKGSAKVSIGATYNPRARVQFSPYSATSNVRLTTSTVSKPAPSAVGGPIDLHGYTVAEAQSITTAALDAWWRRECDMRAAEGLLHLHGAKADFVPPLVIVTGRGLHSVGGPKILPSVLRILRDGKYIINQNTGNVTVYGKRK